MTNNSYLSESHEVRHCVQKYKILGEHVLQVAKVVQIKFIKFSTMVCYKCCFFCNPHFHMGCNDGSELYILQKRLDNMLYVGLTEEHRESATMFANVVGAQVISQLGVSNSSGESAANRKSGQCAIYLTFCYLTSFRCSTAKQSNGVVQFIQC